MAQNVSLAKPTRSAAVLIVDDDIDLVDELVNIVERKNKISAFAAHSSIGAIRYLEELDVNLEIPRVIFLDLHMEDDFSGFRVLRHVRRDSRLRLTPIIVISHSDDQGHVEQAYRFGATSFVNKPYDVRALHLVLETIAEYWCELNVISDNNYEIYHSEKRRVISTTSTGDPVEHARLPNLPGYMRAAKLSVSKLSRLSGVPHQVVSAAVRGESIRTRDIHKLLRPIVPRLSGAVDLTKEIIPGNKTV